MEANLNTPQAAPGDETKFMHAVFSSDEEMLSFYLVMNRFVNSVTNNMCRSDIERLIELHRTLNQFAYLLYPLENYRFDGIKLLVEGLGLYMLQKRDLSEHKRMAHAESVGEHLQCVMKMAARVGTAKKMCIEVHLHLQNLNYLIEKFNPMESDNEIK